MINPLDAYDRARIYCESCGYSEDEGKQFANFYMHDALKFGYRRLHYVVMRRWFEVRG